PRRFRSRCGPGSGWRCACTAFWEASVLERILHCKTCRRRRRVTDTGRPAELYARMADNEGEVNRDFERQLRFWIEGYFRSRHEPVVHARHHSPGPARGTA